MKIAHIDTESTWRGGEQQMVSLMKGLKNHGHENLAVVKKGGALAGKLWGDARSLCEIRPFGEWDVITAAAVRRRIKDDGINIVHAHTGHGVALAALATWGTKVPFVLTRRVDFHLNKNPFSRWKYRRAEKIIAISEGVRKILSNDGIPSAKIAVVPSGIDFSRYEGVSPASMDEMGVPLGSFVVGQVAAFADHKDQATLLRAVALLKNKVPNVRLVLVGEGALRQDLEALAASLGIQNEIRFLGFKDEPLRFLRSFDVFCLSSKEEGLGTSLLDAMALKVPVVATAAGGIPELVIDRQTGFLVPIRDPQALAGALEQAANGGGPVHQMTEAAYQKAKEFDISRTLAGTEAVYEAVLAAS